MSRCLPERWLLQRRSDGRFLLGLEAQGAAGAAISRWCSQPQHAWRWVSAAAAAAAVRRCAAHLGPTDDLQLVVAVIELSPARLRLTSALSTPHHQQEHYQR